jgi:hypothetical protein
MARIAKLGWVAAFLAVFLLPSAGSAAPQSHGAGIARASSMRVAPTRGTRPAQLVPTPLQPNFAPIARAPGLAFNVQSLAAASRRRGRGQSTAPLLWYSPFYSPYADYSYDAQQPQPPYDDQQAPQAAAPPSQFAPSEAYSASDELQPPPPEEGQFILVRLDGQVVFAVAFTAVDGRLTYVTREGLRRSFPVSELDKQATRQMNDANGTSISLPD